MDKNKTLLFKQFEENRGQFIIMSGQVVRFVAIAEDDMDYYYVCYNGRSIHWHSAVGSYTILKGKIDDKDYNEMIRLAKINHWDQLDYFMPSTDDEKEKTRIASEKHKQKMEKVNGHDRYLVPFCWELN